MQLPGSIYSYYCIFVCNICTLYAFSPRNSQNSEQARSLFRKEDITYAYLLHSYYMYDKLEIFIYRPLASETFEFIAVRRRWKERNFLKFRLIILNRTVRDEIESWKRAAYQHPKSIPSPPPHTPLSPHPLPLSHPPPGTPLIQSACLDCLYACLGPPARPMKYDTW
jgi:hypothetical protein